jgi:chaperonin GroEL
MITTNQNAEISEIVAEALYKVGLKGLITLEESQTGKTELKIEEGMFINYGIASNEYIMNQADKTLYLENPLIIVIVDTIENIGDIVKVMEYAKNIERPLIIFTSEIKKEPLSVLLYNQRKQGSNVFIFFFILVYCC